MVLVPLLLLALSAAGAAAWLLVGSACLSVPQSRPTPSDVSVPFPNSSQIRSDLSVVSTGVGGEAVSVGHRRISRDSRRISGLRLLPLPVSAPPPLPLLPHMGAPKDLAHSSCVCTVRCPGGSRVKPR